ncbi:tetratricopeptide repeat protein [Treponema primitia]|uniref:tetratricopeptide repeat protein n=1 Tax=Treponema primitia TaxID=88058 RepID=UPI00397EBDA1
MKKSILLSVLAYGLLCCAAVFSVACVSGPDHAVAGLLSFDEAMTGAVAVVEAKVQGGMEIVIAKIDTPLADLSSFLNEELGGRFDATRKLKIFAQGQTLQATDDASAVGFGLYVGAKVVITGAFERFADFSQFRLRALDVETSQVLATYSARINNADKILANLTVPLNSVKAARVTEDALARFNQGKDLYAEGQLDEAIREFDRAIAISKELTEGYFYRGNAYFDRGDLDRAIADYTAAIRINPNYAFAFYNRGNVYFDQGDLDRAIADYTAALRINPNNDDILDNRGLAYGNKGDYDRAIADHTAALILNPNHTNALFNRGLAYTDKGDLDRAITDWEAVLRINPNHAKAKQNLEIARRQRGR